MRRNSLQEKNFNNLLKGSTFNVLAKVIGIGFGFLASILITRNYGADLIGEIATITSAFTLLSLLALLGNQTLVLKSLPEHIEKYNYLAARKVYRQLLSITIMCTFVVIALWLLLEEFTPFTLLRGLEKYSILVAFLIALSAARELNAKSLRGLGDYKIYSMFELLPAVLLATTAIASIKLGIPEHQFQYAYYIPLLIMGLLSFYFVNTSFNARIEKIDIVAKNNFETPSKSSLVRSSLPMLGVTLSTAVISHFDILMLNYFTTSSDVGVYSVYVKIVTGTAMATHSINAMFAPTVSRLFNSNEAQNLKEFAKKTTLLSLSVTLGAAVFVVLFHKPILGLFGSEFIEEKSTLYILLFSTVVSSFFGSVGLFLNMTGHQVYFFRVMVGAAFINIGLNAVLIPLWGAFGAATATIASVLTWNLLATLKVFKEYGYTLIWGGKFSA